jgi:hypothetical protein
MNDEVAELIERLDNQASRYGGNASDILSRLPENLLDSTSEIEQVMDLKHLAHVQAQSRHPDLKDDWSNIFLQDAEDNLSNGNETATAYEQANAHIDLQLDASLVELVHSDDSEEVRRQILMHIEDNPPQEMASDAGSPLNARSVDDVIPDIHHGVEETDAFDVTDALEALGVENHDLDIDWL